MTFSLSVNNLVLHLQKVYDLVLSQRKKYNVSTATYTSVKYKSYEVSGKTAAVNEPQEDQSHYDAIYIDLQYDPPCKSIIYLG